MTQEEKQLLLKDLCARLPYGVKCACSNNFNGEFDIISPLSTSHIDMIIGGIHPVKPCLRPMSSMTEEEKKELKEATCPDGTGYFDEQYLNCQINHFGEHIGYDFMSDILDWLLANHFDYRGLIEKGLALEAPEGMYKTE